MTHELTLLLAVAAIALLVIALLSEIRRGRDRARNTAGEDDRSEDSPELPQSRNGR